MAGIRSLLMTCLILAPTLVRSSQDGPAVTWLSNAEIEETFRGMTLEGAYASGRTFTETYKSDGRIDYRDDGPLTGGRWSANSDSLCTIYDLDASGGCFRVTRVGLNCYEFYFAVRDEGALPIPDDADVSWTARGSLAGKPGRCANDATV